MTTPRGIRNNNPGNIEWGQDWLGLVPVSKRTDERFCQFLSPEYGIRAMMKILITYTKRDKDKKLTLSEIIRQWAPSHENDTDAYIRAVAAYSGVQPDWEVKLSDFFQLSAVLRGMIRQENGVMPYEEHQFRRAYMLAGLENSA